jgi:hypothetical protein
MLDLLDQLKEFAESREYQLHIDPELLPQENVPDDYGYDLAKEVGIKLELRDYQNDYIVNGIRNKRSLSLSPTSCLDPKTQIEVILDQDALDYLELIRTDNSCNTSS